jgi:hypothetical protein
MRTLFWGLISTIMAPDLWWAKEHFEMFASLLRRRIPVVKESLVVSPLKFVEVISIRLP